MRAGSGASRRTRVRVTSVDRDDPRLPVRASRCQSPRPCRTALLAFRPRQLVARVSRTEARVDHRFRQLVGHGVETGRGTRQVASVLPKMQLADELRAPGVRQAGHTGGAAGDDAATAPPLQRRAQTAAPTFSMTRSTPRPPVSAITRPRPLRMAWSAPSASARFATASSRLVTMACAGHLGQLQRRQRHAAAVENEHRLPRLQSAQRTPCARRWWFTPSAALRRSRGARAWAARCTRTLTCSAQVRPRLPLSLSRQQLCACTARRRHWRQNSRGHR